MAEGASPLLVGRNNIFCFLLTPPAQPKPMGLLDGRLRVSSAVIAGLAVLAGFARARRPPCRRLCRSDEGLRCFLVLTLPRF